MGRSPLVEYAARRPAPFVAAALHAVQFAILLSLALRAEFCCDATHNLILSGQLLSSGLLYDDPYAGYRSYFVPLLYALLDAVPQPFATKSGHAFPVVAAVAFTAVSIVASVVALRRESLTRYLAFALPTLFNPFVLALVPYPIQESAIVLLCVPLFFLIVCDTRPEAGRTLFLALLLGALAYIIRSSLFWLLLPLAIVVALDLARAPRAGIARRVASRAALAGIAALVLFAPQVYIAYAKFGSLNPYPATAVVDAQIGWGIEMLKYATIFDGETWSGLRYASPYAALPVGQKSIGFYLTNPDAGLFLGLSHVWAGLNYDALTPYVARGDLHALTPWLVLSALTVAFGVAGLYRMIASAFDRRAGVLLVAVLVMSCAYTFFSAAEARFGMWGFMALSIGAAHLASSREGRSRAGAIAPSALAYVLSAFLINASLLSAAGVAP